MRPTDPFAMPTWRVDTYQGENGAVVLEHVPTRGELPITIPRFVGRGTFQMTDPNGTPMIREDVTFPIQAQSIQEALSLYLELKDKAFKTWFTERQRQVNEAVARQHGGLVVPTGKQARDILTREQGHG